MCKGEDYKMKKTFRKKESKGKTYVYPLPFPSTGLKNKDLVTPPPVGYLCIDGRI